MKKKDNTESSIVRELAPYMNLGLQLAITVLMGVGLGWWLDNKFNTKPLWMLVCTLSFVAIGLYNFIKTVIDLGKKDKSD